jgi:hypothetical protein
VNAFRGTALLKLELVVVLGELDAVVAVEPRVMLFCGGDRIPEEGV